MVIFYEETKIPATKETRANFIPEGKKVQGRLKTTLPIVLKRDLSLVQHPIRLHSIKDLAAITVLAQDRQCWRGLASQIEKAAVVSRTKKW